MQVLLLKAGVVVCVCVLFVFSQITLRFINMVFQTERWIWVRLTHLLILICPDRSRSVDHTFLEWA